ncbi:LON peptidase substrate-binding domain-containing protein [Trinickia acidisoli]|uniref:LON peptidase substrate-binding domain-containing protein n=1 Tax=Trinickia acidisoli TaxID=2767482 RepID=UPI001A901F6E|nr:LON peptidase substrate-binding domain-containing protein [Trinickia acidisoli]
MPPTPAVYADLPLFPLHTVLFPDGLLPLKIFEARYLDMARGCLRDDSPFGVCLLKSGGEVAQENVPCVPEMVGTLARIEQCDVDDYGMLLVRARGTRRFRLLSHRKEPSGLLVGMAEPLADDVPLEGVDVLAKFGACAEVLERIIEAIRERDIESLPFAEPFRFDDPSWVSNRLSEILQIPLRARQKLMELTDANERIDAVHHYMQQHQLL